MIAGVTWPYVRAEAAAAPRRAALGVTLAAIGGLVLSHAVIPRMPELAIGLLQQGFRLRTLGGVMLFNDVVAVYFAAFYVGLAGLVDGLVVAREQHRLELLLSKPVTPAGFLVARTGSVLLTSVAVGVAVTLVMLVALTAHFGDGAEISATGALGAGLFVTAIALVQLAALESLLVRQRESFFALLAGSGVWLATVMPSAVLLYRPDLLDPRPWLANVLTVSSLVWHDTQLTWLGPCALVLAVPCAVACVGVAGRILTRTDVAG